MDSATETDSTDVLRDLQTRASEKREAAREAETQLRTFSNQTAWFGFSGFLVVVALGITFGPGLLLGVAIAFVIAIYALILTRAGRHKSYLEKRSKELSSESQRLADQAEALSEQLRTPD